MMDVQNTPPELQAALLERARREQQRRQQQAALAPQQTEDMVTYPPTGEQIPVSQMGAWAKENAPESPLSRLVGMAGNGAGFGLVDELSGAVNAGYGALKGYDVGDSYRWGREIAQAKKRNAREDMPWGSTLSELAGGVVSGAGFLKGAQSVIPFLRQSGASARRFGTIAVPAVEGAAYGAGEMNDNRSNGAVAGGLFGAAGGAVGSAVAKYGGAAFRRLAANSKQRAERAVVSKIQDPSAYITRLTQAAQDGTPLAIADLDKVMQRQLSGVARSTPEAAEDIGKFLETRQAGQNERLSSMMAQQFGDETAQAATARLDAKRAAESSPLYERAFEGGPEVDATPVLETIANKIDGPSGAKQSLTASERAYKDIADQMRGIEFDELGRVKSVNVESDLRRLHSIKEGIGDKIEKFQANGDRAAARDLTILYNQLNDTLQETSSLYNQGNRTFEAGSKVIDAIDFGQSAASPSKRAGDVIPEFQGMAPDQQSSARIGFGDKLRQRVEATPYGTNAARPLTADGVRDKMSAMAIDPDAVTRQVGDELDMFTTRNVATGGSRTADNLADQADVMQLTNSPLSNLLQGRPFVAAGQVSSKVIDGWMKGRGSGVRQEMAQILMKTGREGAETVERIIQDQRLSDRQKMQEITRLASMAGGGSSRYGGQRPELIGLGLE